MRSEDRNPNHRFWYWWDNIINRLPFWRIVIPFYFGAFVGALIVYIILNTITGEWMGTIYGIVVGYLASIIGFHLLAAYLSWNIVRKRRSSWWNHGRDESNSKP